MMQFFKDLLSDIRGGDIADRSPKGKRVYFDKFMVLMGVVAFGGAFIHWTVAVVPLVIAARKLQLRLQVKE